MYPAFLGQDINMTQLMGLRVRGVRLVNVVPSSRQAALQQMEFNSFVHFTMNTYTGKEWGRGQRKKVYLIR